MSSYEQTLRLFERWCRDELAIEEVDKVTEAMIRRYINDLQERGKYTFYCNDKSKETNHPDRRRDFRKPVSVCTINNYIRNLRVFFNWLDVEDVTKKNPMKKIRQLKTNRKAKKYMDIYTLSRILGHSSVTVTEQAYLDLTDEDLGKRYQHYSPVNAMGK